MSESETRLALYQSDKGSMCLGRATVDDYNSPLPILCERLNGIIDGVVALLGFVCIEHKIGHGVSELLVLFRRPECFKDETRLANPRGPDYANDVSGFRGPFPNWFTQTRETFVVSPRGQIVLGSARPSGTRNRTGQAFLAASAVSPRQQQKGTDLPKQLLDRHHGRRLGDRQKPIPASRSALRIQFSRASILLMGIRVSTEHDVVTTRLKRGAYHGLYFTLSGHDITRCGSRRNLSRLHLELAEPGWKV